MEVEIVLVCAVFVLAAFIQSSIGFGMALTAVPALLIFYDERVVVPTITVISLLNTGIVAWHARRHVKARILVPMMIGTLAGLPVGLTLLTTFSGPGYKIAAAVIVILLAIPLLGGWRRPVKQSHFALIPVGFMSGALGASLGIGGPPIVLFLTSQEEDKLVFRANLCAYFSLADILILLAFANKGLLGREVGILSLVLLPAMLLGMWLGFKIATRIPHRIFQRIAMLLVLAGGCLLLATNLRTLFG